MYYVRAEAKMDESELRCVNTWNRREPTSHKFLSETGNCRMTTAFNSKYVKEKKMEEEEETYN